MITVDDYTIMVERSRTYASPTGPDLIDCIAVWAEDGTGPDSHSFGFLLSNEQAKELAKALIEVAEG